MKSPLEAWAEQRIAPLLALTTLAVAEPLYELLARNPEFWIARHVSTPWRLILATAIFLLPPLLLWLPAALVDRWSRRWGGLLFVPLLAFPASLLALIVLKRVPALPGIASLVVAVGLGIGFSILHRRSAAMRWLLGVLALLSLVSPARFVVGMAQTDSSEVASDRPQPVTVPPPSLPVILVVFDELPVSTLMDRNGQVDSALFPHFAELAQSSVWFRNATSSGAFTIDSMPSMLTGRYPGEELVPESKNYPRSLYTLLEGSHTVFSMEPRTELCPPRICDRSSANMGALIADLETVYLHLVVPDDLASSLPDVTTAWGGFAGEFEDRAKEVRSFLARLAPSTRPPLIVLHIVLPHHPWIYLPSGQRYHPGDSMFFEGFDPASQLWTDEIWPVLQGLQRHILQSQFADRLLGEVQQRLQSLGWWDSSLLVVTADHGISFDPGGAARLVDRSNIAEVLAVPLFVKIPGQKDAKATESPVELVDLLPTVVDMLGIEADWPFDGRHLFSKPDEEIRVRRGFNKPGAGITLNDEELAGRRIAVGRKYAWLGRDPATGALDPYRTPAAAPELIGASLFSLPLGSESPALQAEVEDLAAWDDLDPDADWLPARVRGRLSGAPGGSILAFAANGVVRATTRTLEGGGFSFLLPPDSFGEGTTEIRILALSEEGGSRELHLVDIEPEVTYELEADGSDLRISSSDGGRWSSTPGHFEGDVQDAILVERSNRVDFIGWGRHPTTGKIPLRFVMFVGGMLRRAGPPNLDRPDLREHYRLPGREDAGFVWTLPNRDLVGEIRFFALGEDGKASELHYERKMQPRHIPPRGSRGN